MNEFKNIKFLKRINEEKKRRKELKKFNKK